MGKKGLNYWEKKFQESLGKSNADAAQIMRKNNQNNQEQEREIAPEWVMELFNQYPDAYGIGEIRQGEYVLVLKHKVGRTGNKSEVLHLNDGCVIGRPEEVSLVEMKYLRKHYITEEEVEPSEIEE